MDAPFYFPHPSPYEAFRLSLLFSPMRLLSLLLPSFVTIMPGQRLRHGSSLGFLLSGRDTSYNDDYASLPSRSCDDVSNNSPSLFSVLSVDFILLIILDCNITLRVVWFVMKREWERSSVPRLLFFPLALSTNHLLLPVAMFNVA